MNNNSNAGVPNNFPANAMFQTPLQVRSLTDSAGNLHFQVLDTTCQVNISNVGDPELTINSHAAIFNLDTFSITAFSGSAVAAWDSTSGQWSVGTGSTAALLDGLNGKVQAGNGTGVILDGPNRKISINILQVLGQRITGWADPTGTLSRATFDQSTVTLPVLAQHVAQLILDLKTHGMLGT